LHDIDFEDFALQIFFNSKDSGRFSLKKVTLLVQKMTLYELLE